MTGDKKDSVCCGWCAAAVGSGGRTSSFCDVSSDHHLAINDIVRGSQPIVPPATGTCARSDQWEDWAILILRDQRQS